MKKIMKITVLSILVAFFVFTNIIDAKAAENDITEEMKNPDFWKKLPKRAKDVVMTRHGIQMINDANIQEPEINLIDLEKVTEVGKGEFEKFEKELFLEGEKINKQDYISKFEAGHEQMPLTYAVTIKRANIKAWPTTEKMGYSPDDPYDELQISILEMNEPFIVGGKCIVDGKNFYYGMATSCAGWIQEEDIAIINDEVKWIKEWRIYIADDDFVITTKDNITLEPISFAPEISELQIYAGTILKRVPEEEIPPEISEENQNYLVYVPTRDEDGNYVKKMAIIKEKEGVNIGCFKFTQGNFYDVALKELGKKYEWKNLMKEKEDSAMFCVKLMKYFGFELPRNTNEQRAMKGVIDISKMTTEEKVEYLKTLPAGSILYFPGYTMNYMGTVDNIPYVISDYGVLSDSDLELERDSQRSYEVMITPLTIKRQNGLTWLESLDKVLSLKNKNIINQTYDIWFDYRNENELILQNVDMGRMVIKPDDPTKEGYTFGGWYTDSECTNLYDFDKEVYDDMTLYAKWISNTKKSTNISTFDVSFKTNGGSKIPSQKIKVGNKVTKPENPTKSGYIFAGWYTNSKLTTAFKFSTAVKKNISLYAKWKVATLKIKATSKKKKVTLKWSSNAQNISKVTIYCAKGNAKFKKVATISSTTKSYTVKKLKSKAAYRFRIDIKDGTKTLKSSIVKATVK